jgi:pimeloyl-ACP methyl ester carboxylesterase
MTNTDLRSFSQTDLAELVEAPADLRQAQGERFTLLKAKSNEPMATWLLLRGLTRETAHWGGFVDALQRALPQARIMALDLPGNGQLHAMPSPPTIAAMVDWCRTELARRGVRGPVHLLAMSLGAMVAAEWACRAPQEVAGAVLINTSFAPLSPFYRRLRPRNFPRLLRLALGAGPAAWEQAILELTSNRAAERAGVLPVWTATRLQRPVRALNALRQLLAAAHYRVRPQAPAVPLLLLGSEQDRLVDVRCTLAAAQRWGSAVRLHPWAGHDLPLDDPDWVIAQLRDWLAAD